MPQIIVQRDDSRDTDGDGLSDVAEFVIGTSEQQSDTDDDGISDAAEIEQRLDPLDDRGFPTGVISSLPLAGEAKQVAVSPGSGDIDRIAYVATGSAGLALVDVSVFNNPVVLGQVALSGDSVDVAVSTSRDLAVVAGSVGVQLVDVSDPMLPVLAQTVALPTGARAIVIADGIAYAAAGRRSSASTWPPANGCKRSTLARLRLRMSPAKGRCSTRSTPRALYEPST